MHFVLRITTTVRNWEIYIKNREKKLKILSSKSIVRKLEKIVPSKSLSCFHFRYLDPRCTNFKSLTKRFISLAIRVYIFFPPEIVHCVLTGIASVSSGVWDRSVRRGERSRIRSDKIGDNLTLKITLLFLHDDISRTNSRIEINRKAFQRLRFHAFNDRWLFSKL